MNIPQTGRKPVPLSQEDEYELLRKRRKQDKIDPFAIDPNPDISKLGRLALRRGDINDLFALGDLCASHSAVDGHLSIAYVEKTLIAYNKAQKEAANTVDRKRAERAIDQYLQWVIDTAQSIPTRRNLAVALWAATNDDEQNTIPAYAHSSTLLTLLETYRQRTLVTPTIPSDEDRPITNTNKDGTHAALDAFPSLSDESMTVADLEIEVNSLTQANDSYAASGETHFDDRQKPAYPSEAGDNTQALPQETTHIKQQSDYRVGDYIEGRYEVAEVLWGGMGVVYLCYDHNNREPIAIKTFQARFLDNERAVARFSNETLTWVRLEKHRHIVQAKLVQHINGRPYILLEYVSGQEQIGVDLRSWINRRRLDISQSLEFALHIALGMQHATTQVPGLVHRDLKPANILVTHENIAKVTDFGLAYSLDLEGIPLSEEATPDQESHIDPNDRLTKLGTVVGTAPYMSPEQCQSKEVDIRSDIYAFGCVLYEMLVGRRVFKARKFPEWAQAHINEQPAFDPKQQLRIPSRIRDLVLSCLEKNPHNRPKNWGEIVHTLTIAYQELTGNTPILEISGTELAAHDLMDKGYSLTALKRYEEALVAYDRAIALQPDYAWAWARKGRTLRLLEQYDTALHCYSRALEIQPHYAWAWNGKGIVYQRMNHLEEALDCFKTATRINPNNVWNWYNRADVLQTMNRYEEAITLLKRGLQLDPEHPNSWAKIGQIHRLLNNHPEAIDAYEQAIRYEPTYAWAYNGCGLALRAVNRHTDALIAFKKAARYDPNEVWHWYNLADTFLDMGQYKEALDPAEKAIKADPKHALGWAKLGQIKRYLRHHDDALEAYTRALDLDPDSAFAANGKGIVLEQLEHYELALVCYQKAADIKPTDVWHWYNQGNVLILLGRFDQALTALQKAIEVDPHHIRSWARSGNVLRHLNRLEEALKACQKAVAISPDYAWVWNELGTTLEAFGQKEEALDAYRQAAHLAPNEPFYIYKQTDLLIALNNDLQGSKLLELALKIDDQNHQIWGQYGQILRRLGRHEEAVAAYSRATEIDPTYHWAWKGHGLALSQLKRHEEALTCFEKALELDASNIWYWYHLADEQLFLGKTIDALNSLDKSLLLDNRHVESWGKRGQALRKLGQYDEALAAFDLAVLLNPRYAWAWNGRGLTFKDLGQKENSLKCYKRAAKEDPQMIWYTINLVDLLLELQRREEALIAIDRALNIHPLHAIAWARRGQVLRRLYRYEEAIESYSRAIELSPKYSWAWNGKGLCLSALGYWDKAMVCYRNAIENEPNDIWFWHNYGESLEQQNMFAKAKTILEEGLLINPNHQPTRDKLDAIKRRLGEL